MSKATKQPLTENQLINEIKSFLVHFDRREPYITNTAMRILWLMKENRQP